MAVVKVALCEAPGPLLGLTAAITGTDGCASLPATIAAHDGFVG
jgi:hypothetical protein